ncbi:hypothetical protein [Puniceibacterium sp. IMCC21224]|uniref:hypothetical protein n=1 Tax=Puniceibacterium sp. IMCC21224 TaxID=1618204 RepID=UPI00065D305F|nr:hypothetical protein [Puniceibacterium sp. IMCC21224]KMK68590.1 hypothetical protein IMCC21224_113473 [Puniceibacterium sp. IMCC21224]
MTQTPVRSTYVAASTFLDDVIGNRDGSTVRVSAANLAQQIAGTGAVADMLHALQDLVATDAAPAAGGPVRAAFNQNSVLSGDLNCDGVTDLEDGDRILAPQQTDPADNGIYVVNTSGAWTRASDMDSAGEVAGTIVYVSDGVQNGGKTYFTQSVVATLGADDILFVELSNQAVLRQLVVDLSASLALVATSGEYGDLTGTPSLGTAAATDATAYATVAQGTTADTAVQPGDLAEVATSGDYADLTGKPTLGTAAATAATAYATAAQGAKADTATQPGDLGTAATTAVSAYATAAQGATADSAVQPGDIGTAAATAATDYATAAQGDKADTAVQAATLEARAARAQLLNISRAEIREAWTSALTGEPGDKAAISEGTVEITDAGGSVLVISGNEYSGSIDIAPRQVWAVEPGRAYQARMVCQRVTDPIDPSGHAVEVRMQNLSKTKASVSNLVVETLDGDDVTEAAGRIETVFTFGHASVSADYSVPATTRYAVPFFRVYGDAHELAVELVSVEDVTGLILKADASALGTASAEDVGYFATAAQGATADSAVQPGDLGTAAATDASDYATAVQGAKADTATQPDDLADVATSGDYDDLTGKPTLGTAAATASSAYATAAQGVLAASAVQPGDLTPVAASGSYDDLSDKPTLGTAAATDASAYATAAQGALADAAPAALVVETDARTDADAAIRAQIGGVEPLPRGVGLRIRGVDDRTLQDLNWDRASEQYRWDGHALSGDVTGLTRDVGGAAQLPRGVALQVRGVDDRVVSQMLWDRASEQYRWDGHALSGDVTGLTRDVGGAAQLPRGVALQLRGADDRVVSQMLWDRDLGKARWDGHALSGEDQVYRAGETVDADVTSVRARRVDIDVKTDPSGLAWVPLPPVRTPHVSGINSSGTELSFRRSWGLPIRGRDNVGAYDPGSTASTASKGTFTDTLAAAGDYAAGDYFEQSAVAGNTVNALTYAQGDLAVSDGSDWIKQAAPTVNPLFAGQFATITGAGLFKGIALTVGARLIFAGRQKNSGVTDQRHWSLADADRGDICLMGETATPDAAPPTSPQNGDLWFVTASDGDFVAGDGLLRVDGAWSRLPGSPVTTVADGAAVWLSCDRASQIEVRRADTSTTQAAVALKGMTETKRPVVLSRDIWWVGDSMPGYASAELIELLSDRTVTVQSMSGATSYEVLAHVERTIRDLGDPYANRVLISWHGENNGNDVEQVNEVNARLASMSGTVQQRCLLMSKLGQYQMSWTGSRIAVVYHEQQISAISGAQTTRMRNFIRDNYVASLFDTRAELCASAGSTPDLIHPGNTEAETAAAYGIVPFSYFFPLNDMPWKAADLNFVGYRSDAGLPAGGSDLDYHIRSVADGSDGVGQLIVKEDGTWTKRDITNVTHMVPDAGNVALANRINLKLAEKGW